MNAVEIAQKLASLRAQCDLAEMHGLDAVNIVHVAGRGRMPFRGELLCENSDGNRVYRVKTKAIRKFIARFGLPK